MTDKINLNRMKSSKKIDPQDLADYIHTIELPPYYVDKLVESFNLPSPANKQVMEITLRIPVKDMDPMGDTYTMGVEELNSIIGGRAGYILDSKEMISTVEILERKGNGVIAA